MRPGRRDRYTNCSAILRPLQHPTMPDGHMQMLRLDSDSLNGTRYGDGGSLQITMPADFPFEDALAHAQVTTDST